MEIEIADGVLWDDEKPLYQQAEEAQSLITVALATTVIKRTYETCLGNKRRVTLREYQLTDTLLLNVIPIYNTGPLEREFMGIYDFTYLIKNAE